MNKVKQVSVFFAKAVSGFLLLVMSTLVIAQNFTVSSGFVRETIPGTSISSAYMTLTNTSEKSVTLVGASSKISPRIEIHQHTMSNGMMKMRKLDSIVINSKDTVMLQPSGLHLMIFDIKEPLKHGDLITLTLHFSSHANVEIQLPVQSINRQQHHH